MTIWYIVPRRLRAPARATLATQSCPDCDYDLRSLLSLPDDSVASTLGPSVRPECGIRWPLVPPTIIAKL